MGKHTDLFMKIPVRVYQTELEDFDETSEYGVGWARVYYGDLMMATWYEGYAKGDTIGLGDKGKTEFTLTIIRCGSIAYFCTWSIKDFERELNKFMDKVDGILPTEDKTNSDIDEQAE